MSDAQQEPMKSYRVPENVIQAILSYLAKQPYAEVVLLISALQQMPEVQEGPVDLSGLSPEELRKFFEELDTDTPNPE